MLVVAVGVAAAYFIWPGEGMELLYLVYVVPVASSATRVAETANGGMTPPLLAVFLTFFLFFDVGDQFGLIPLAVIVF